MDDRDALQILSDRRGTMYDPHVVDAFFALHAVMSEAPESAPATAPAVPQRPVELADERDEDQELEAFFELGRLLSEPISVVRLGEVLWMQLGKRLPASAFVLYAYDESLDAIVAAYSAGGADTARVAAQLPLALGERLSGWVAATGQTVMNSDARLDLDESVREHSSLRSALAVRAATTDGRASSVLSFYAEAPDAFAVLHRRLVEAAARIVGRSVVTSSREPAATASRSGTRVYRGVTST
jgi:hypothetical protein